MTKSDLIAATAYENNLTVKKAADIVELVFDGFTNTLMNGGRIEIRGFGSFTVREHKAHKGRNPKTGDATNIKTKRVPFFKVGKELKKMVDDK
ncbi:MAG TPA: HU family DNA-binding protein [Smithella sp.]|nr:HU family DNA-binding protein [Smithella sp.]